MEAMTAKTLVLSLGFGLGIAFGATAQRTNFCTMGAISDIALMGDWNRFRAWLLAIAVAILGSQGLHLTGFVDLNQSVYLTPNFGWFGAIVGGLLFGFGMTMSGGCGSKTTVRLGAGNLKSLIVFLFLGIFAYMTMRGLIGIGRMQLEGLTNGDLRAGGLAAQGIPDIVAKLTSIELPTARWLIALGFGGGLLWFCFASPAFRASPRNIIGGLVIGVLIPAGWFATGVVGRDEFEPLRLASFTFVAPVGESLIYLMTFTGATINFGIAVIGGVILGSFVAAKASGEFRIEAFVDAADMGRHMIGGALMGVGGVMALGCTIGQGITGTSTLALGSLLAFLSIVAGGFFGIKYLEHGSLTGAFQALLARG
jgi:uncharacterized protein